MPAEEVGRYSVERDPAAEQDITNYVHGQARDETVQHVERVKTEYVMGEPHEIWDVTTDKNRWWVITNLTNLYLQKHFPSLDYTLSFHVGLMMRLRSRPEGADSSEPDPFDEVLRRQEQPLVFIPSRFIDGRRAGHGSMIQVNCRSDRNRTGCRCGGRSSGRLIISIYEHGSRNPRLDFHGTSGRTSASLFQVPPGRRDLPAPSGGVTLGNRNSRARLRL